MDERPLLALRTALLRTFPADPLGVVTALLATSIFFTGMSSAAIAPYRAITALHGREMDNSTYAIGITLSSLATALASLLLGSLSDRICDRRRLVIVSAVMGGLAYGLIYLFPHHDLRDKRPHQNADPCLLERLIYSLGCSQGGVKVPTGGMQHDCEPASAFLMKKGQQIRCDA